MASSIGSSRSSINSDQRDDDHLMVSLRLWLLTANKLINKSSVQIMKLGFLGDKVKLPFDRLDKAKEVSDIFNLLYEHHDSIQKAVQRLVYALCRLGHRRNGFKCVRMYSERVGQKLPPKYETRNESQEFGLCQCLVDICVEIKKEVGDGLRKYCGHHLLGTDRENIESVATLFIRMYQDKQVTLDDQQNLADALHVVNAEGCIKCIRKYRVKYGLSELIIRSDRVNYQRIYSK